MGIEQLYVSADIPQLIEGMPISNLMYAVWCSREDLQIAFNLSSREGQANFYGWCTASLHRDYGISMPAPHESHSFENASSDAKLWKLAWQFLPSIERVLSIWIRFFPGKFRRFAKKRWNIFCAKIATNVIARPTLFNRKLVYSGEKCISGNHFLTPGTNLIGYAFVESGVGEHLRMSAKSFSKTNIEFGVVNFDFGVPSRAKAVLRTGKLQSLSLYNTNIFHINADQMIHVFGKLGENFFNKRFNIIYPFWELSVFPMKWTPFLKCMDEIWAPTRFIQDSISSALGKPVQYMPVGIELPQVKNKGRRFFGIPEGTFTFLITFDFFSFIHRKNPWASVRAFVMAFPRLDESVNLVIKVMNADETNEDWIELTTIAARDKRIIIINKIMSIDELLSLKVTCDCYVSLHRAEGLGLGPMEAMLLGKPTILTNYSGITDYANDLNSCLVNYSLIPVQIGQYVDTLDQVWADPDIEHAAWHMRSLVTNFDLADKLGKEAQSFMHTHFSPVRCGFNYRRRLLELSLI